MEGACISGRRAASGVVASCRPCPRRGVEVAGFVLCALLATSWPAGADEASSHRRAALELYRELRLGDSQATAAAVTDLVLQLAPNLAPDRDLLEEFAAEVVESDAYAGAHIDVYVDLFDEEELRTLTWLFRHETLRRYREKRVEIIRRTTRATVELFRAELPRLHERIRERSGHRDRQ